MGHIFPHTLVKSRAERLWIFLLWSGFLNTSFERGIHTQYTVAKLERMKLRKNANFSTTSASVNFSIVWHMTDITGVIVTITITMVWDNQLHNLVQIVVGPPLLAFKVALTERFDQKFDNEYLLNCNNTQRIMNSRHIYICIYHMYGYMVKLTRGGGTRDALETSDVSAVTGDLVYIRWMDYRSCTT